MRTHGYKPNIVLGLDTFDRVAKWVAKTYRAKERPTAIFSLNHVTAIRLLRSLVDAGLAIPKDVALVGFGDFELASLISPPLTVVAQSPVALAKQAMTLLMDRIKHNRLGTEFEPVKVVLPVTLTVRASCGCKTLSEEA
jgi:LacI family transcriptional regulator